MKKTVEHESDDCTNCAFGTITKGLLNGLVDFEVGGWVETIQMTALLRTARILRRVQETEGDNYTNCDWCFWHGNKRIIKGPEGFGRWRSSGDLPNNCVIENGQNTEKSPGDLRRLTVTQSPVKDQQLTLM